MPHEDFEVIVVLNGCNEPYRTMILDNYSSIPGFSLLLIQTDIPGVSNARNIALDRIKGEYVCFLDDDDYISPYYLEDLYRHASKSVVALCRPIAFLDSGAILRNYRISNTYRAFAEKGVVPFYVARSFFSGPCMKLIHKDVIADRRFDPKMSIGEDSLFMFLISDRFSKVSFAPPRAIYYRRIREGSLTQNKRSLIARTTNALKLMGKEIWIYIHAPSKYNIYFFLTRILGAVKAIFLG